VRLKRVLGIGKVRKREGHWVAPFRLTRMASPLGLCRGKFNAGADRAPSAPDEARADWDARLSLSG
jgi:hypothetical protein